LNYDDVLDTAYKMYYSRPRYCFSLEAGSTDHERHTSAKTSRFIQLEKQKDTWKEEDH